MAQSELGIYDSRHSPDCQPASEAHTGNGRGEKDWLKSMYDIVVCNATALIYFKILVSQRIFMEL